MLEGCTKEELKEWAKECTEKYNKLFVQTIQKALIGEIGTNNQMIEELKVLNSQYEWEMNDYVENFSDNLDGGWIKHFENAEKEGKNVILEAKDCLDGLGIATKVMNQQYFVDEDNHICDENGNRLSSDFKHRVFEVIPGGKA